MDRNMDVEASDISSFKTVVTSQGVGGETSSSFSKHSDAEDMSDNAEDGSKCQDTDVNKSAVPDEKINSNEDVDEVQEMSDQSPEVLLTEQQETALLNNLDKIGNVEKVGPVLREQQQSALLKNFDEMGDVEKFDPQQQEVTLLKNLNEIGNVEKLGPVICLLDKKVANNQKNNVQQHTEKEANDDLQILCIEKSPETNELVKQNDVVKEAQTKPHSCDVTAPAVDISQTFAHNVLLNEGPENNNFEEISEGSIDPMEQDVLEDDELFSDVEIIGEYFVPAKDQNKKNNVYVHKNKPKDSKDKYKNSEPTEGKVITPGTIKVNIMADNDEISDTSMSDHADDNLSLEEISDDDLEPSKRKRKSSGSVTVMAKNDPLNNKSTTFNKNEKSQKLDKTNANKHSVSEVGDGSSGSSRKRHKSSNEISTNKELPPENEKSRLFTTKTHVDSRNEEKRQQAKDQDGSSTRNTVPSDSRKLSQSSKSWRQEDTDKTQSPGDLAAFKRKLMVDSSCQSEPQLLKGKIVQCNINPVKAKPESEKKQGCADDDSTISDLLEKLKHCLPSAPEGLISEVISPQPSHSGAYSLRMGPLKVSHMNSSEFINAVLGATDNFSFVFDNHCQGIFKATFTKPDSLQSLMRWLTNNEWDTKFMVISINTCEKESQTSICKATLLVNKPDKQKDSQKAMNNETKLVLTGVSEGVNMEFVQLLFPQAQKVAAGFNRTISLEFSSGKVLEDILSTYRQLDINGSNISMSQHNLQDTDTGDELETVTKGGSECGGQSTLLDKEYVHSEPSSIQPADEDQTQSGSEVVMDDIRVKLESGQPVSNGEVSAVLAAQDSDGTPSKTKSPVLPIKADAKILLKDNSLSQKHTDIDVNIATESNSLNEQGNQEEMKGTDSENVDMASSLEQAETEGKSLSLILSDEGSKLEADVQAKAECEADLPIRKDISVHECKSEMPVSSVNNKYVDDDDKEAASNLLADAVVTAAADTDAGDGKFEDVSDDEMVNHNKPDDGGEHTLKRSADDIKSENVVSKDGMKDSATEDFLQEDGQKSSNKQPEASSNEGKHLDSRLVMTDGDLEITMEVIDIDDSVEIGKVVYPSRGQCCVQASCDSRIGTYSSLRGPYEQYYTNEYLSGSQYSRPSHIREPTVPRSDSFIGKDRTSSDNWNRSGRQQHGTDPHFRDTSESQGRPRESPYHSRYDNETGTKKSHRDLHRRRSRSRSLSIVSVSLEDQEGTVRRSPYRRSNEDPVPTSRSPISISSKSCSLSPVSRSPSLELPKSELENKELVKTVQHFLKLAKGIQLKEKRGRRRMSSRHSRSPVPQRSRSPQKASSSRFLYSRSQHAKRSRSPQRSKSPALISSLKHRHERSLSPVSSINDSKRSRTDHFFSGKRGGPYSKGRDSSPSYKKSRTYRSGDYSHNIKSKPGPWPAQNYRSSDQPWQPPYMAYQASQNSGPPHVNNIYNPAYPPPQVPAGMYPGSSAPPPAYPPNYSSIPPPSIPPSYNIPPPSAPNSISQPYQSPFQMYQSHF